MVINGQNEGRECDFTQSSFPARRLTALNLLGGRRGFAWGEGKTAMRHYDDEEDKALGEFTLRFAS